MNLAQWLNYIGTVHRTEIDLSLTRIKRVAKSLAITQFPCPVISVAGTNGKGSCVATLERILLTAGYRVGTFTSPHLFTFNERIRIQGIPVTDQVICDAFAQIEIARQNISLTFFEFNTLAAGLILQQQAVDVAILEVGLGGRLDAVNIFDADIAIITTIALDHTDRLGNTRTSIGYEKSGIFRPGKHAVCGDFAIPAIIHERADTSATRLYAMQRDYGYQQTLTGWQYWSNQRQYLNLPLPALELQNVATALKALELLPDTFVITEGILQQALSKLSLAGRYQVVPGAIEYIFDVAHNPAGGEWLAQKLSQSVCRGKTLAVIGMLADKDQLNTLKYFVEQINAWYVGDLHAPRGSTADAIKQNLQQLSCSNVATFASIELALRQAIENSLAGDRIIVFGSFHTVSEALSSGVIPSES